MSKLTENFVAVNEGRMAKSEFLRQVKQGFPGVISPCNSYEDAISILRRKQLLSEDVVYKCKGDKFPLESIERGLRWELEEMGLCDFETPSPAEYKKARFKAIDNLCKDPEYYLKKIACCCDKCKQSQEGAEQKHGKNYKQPEEHMKEVKPKNNLQEGKKKVMKESAYTEKRYGYTEDDSVKTQLVQALLKKINPETGKKYTQAEARKKADKMIRVQKAKKAEVKEFKTPKMNPQEGKLLKETITKSIVKILSEAATTNLAQLSDKNASIQNVPAILNNLENIVTEIESFIIKEQTKIQGVFDSIGDIKNEDNIPVGYKFVQPIMDAFKRDLEPVLQKVNFDNIKMPEAPELNQDPMNPEMGGEMEQPEPKQTMFTPKEPLAENKQPKKRYTR